jgi:hypothetical protein
MKNLSPRLFQFPCFLLVLAALLPSARGAASTAGQAMNTFNVENSVLVDNPWAAVDSSTGNIVMPANSQLQVDDSGDVGKSEFSPSVAVGDLNGDGKPDLIVADPRGAIWFFPNIGTKEKAAFGHGEVIPIWFGAYGMVGQSSGYPTAVVPRLQLADFNGDGTLDLIAGTFDGRLYVMANQGNSTQPLFKQPADLESIEVPTHTQDMLWCNFLAPFLCDWSGRGVLDLVMGEGTYSANSIYLFKNQSGPGQKPSFDEKHEIRMLPGNGLEQLTPCVVDWNGDGKPDVVFGDRTGYIALALNNSTDPDNPTFADIVHLKFGTQSQFGQLTTVTVADLNGNKLPNILFSNTSGELFYAVNTGTPGHPVFASDPVPLKGINPYPKIYKPTDWSYATPFGNSYDLLVATSADVEKGFTPPDGHKGKFALRAYLFAPTTTAFTGRFIFPPDQENPWNEHILSYNPNFTFTDGKRYKVTFSVKTGGDGDAGNFRFQFDGYQNVANGGGVNNTITKEFSPSGAWTTVSETVDAQSQNGQKGASFPMKFSIRWNGTESVYVDDVVISHDD